MNAFMNAFCNTLMLTSRKALLSKDFIGTVPGIPSKYGKAYDERLGSTLRVVPFRHNIVNRTVKLAQYTNTLRSVHDRRPILHPLSTLLPLEDYRSIIRALSPDTNPTLIDLIKHVNPREMYDVVGCFPPSLPPPQCLVP